MFSGTGILGRIVHIVPSDRWEWRSRSRGNKLISACHFLLERLVIASGPCSHCSHFLLQRIPTTLSRLVKPMADWHIFFRIRLGRILIEKFRDRLWFVERLIVSFLFLFLTRGWADKSLGHDAWRSSWSFENMTTFVHGYLRFISVKELNVVTLSGAAG